tara:strand:+ start:260 stop:490 length:231 start_codon:yes stop_codon:yes gene_type:complete
LNSKRSIQADVVQGDLGVVIDVSQDEIAVKLSDFKGEFIFADEAITALGFEVQDLILPAREMNEISASATFDDVVA